MKNLTGLAFIIFLCIFPIAGYLIRDKMNMEPDYVLGFIGFLLLGKFLFDRWRSGENIRIPHYLFLFGIFVVYTVLSAIFISGKFMENGPIKYFYSDPFIRSFAILLLVENVEFSSKALKKGIGVLSIMLLFAATVSIIQVKDPLFFLYQPVREYQGVPSERVLHHLETTIEKIDDSKVRMLAGYRLSIYSWINGLSVGIDSLAIFSILLGLNAMDRKKKGILWLASAFICFLSSSRWIILNFFVVSFQVVLKQKNILLNVAKYLFIVVGLVFLIGFSASLIGVDIHSFVQNRLMDKGANTRLYAFEVFSKVFPSNPIFGTGGADTPEMLRLIAGKTSQIHVGYLKLFYYYGLIGGFIYLLFVAAFLYDFWQRAKRSAYFGSFFAILALVVANTTLVELDPFYHGIILAIIFSRHIDNHPPSTAIGNEPENRKNTKREIAKQPLAMLTP